MPSSEALHEVECAVVYSQEQVLLCDGCWARAPWPDDDDYLPNGWRIVRLLGWVGEFHACSERCEYTLRARVNRPEE
jgi:hypothetical protein